MSPPPINIEDFLESLNEVGPEVGRDAAIAEDCARSLLSFIEEMWDFVEPATPFVPGWAIEAICDHLEAVSYGEIKRLLINVPPGFMKLAADSTPIITPNGWKTHGDIGPGDFVFGPDGLPTKVLSISPKAYADYEVTFSTHETIKVNGDHLWTVYDRFFHGWKTVDTKYIAESNTEKNRNRFFIPDTSCLQFTEKQLTIHPYLLGCWLGDGNSTKACIAHDVDDTAHITKIGSLGYDVRMWKTKNKTRTRYSTFKQKNKTALSLLRDTGLYGNKHIPNDYMFGSIEQRLELLAGLIDTDGTVDKIRGRVQIGTVIKDFASQINSLVLSLGMRPYIVTTPVVDYGKYKSDNTYYIVCFNPTVSIPTAIPRKKINKTSFAKRFRAVVSAKKTNTPEIGHCLRVSRNDGLYVIGNTNLVTHNSMAVDVFWPAWEWGPLRRPSERYICAAYASSLTERDNIRFRQVIQCEKYRRLWGHQFGPSKEQFNIVKVANDRTGWKLATSVGGVGTGERGSRVLIDDPNSVKDAESQVVRDDTNRWFTEVVPTRLSSPEQSAIIVIQQRTHETDVSGTILEKELDYTHLMIPMSYDPSRHCVTSIGWEDPRGMVDGDPYGEPLSPYEREKMDGVLAFPERFPAHVVKRDSDVMGPYAASGQFQQQPEPRGGGIFKLEWWQDWPQGDMPDPPPGQTVQVQFPPFEYICASLDTAFTEKEENDPSAMVVMGIWRSTGKAKIAPRLMTDNGVLRMEDDQRIKIMLIYAWEKHLAFRGPPEEKPYGVTDAEWKGPLWREQRRKNWGLVEWVQDTCQAYRVDHLVIEARANGITIAQELQMQLKDEDFGVEMNNPTGQGDKVARAYSVQHLFSNARVYAPLTYQNGQWDYPAWARLVIDRMKVFPKGARDDLPDAVTQALRHLRDIGMALRSEESEQVFEDDNAYRRSSGVALYDV